MMVPSFNEEAAIPSLLDHMEKLELRSSIEWEAVFVDDGSSDATWVIMHDLRRTRPWMRLVQHPQNLGLGAALRTGFRESRGSVVCTIDRDGTCRSEFIPRLPDETETGADAVIAAPWHPESESAECGRVRTLISRSASLPFRWLPGGEVHSFTCMFRAYTRSAIDKITFSSDGFDGVTEILVPAFLNGLRVREVPYRPGVRTHGESKLPFVSTTLGHLRLELRLAWLLARKGKFPLPSADRLKTRQGAP